MLLLVNLLVLVVALLHAYFFVLESILWTKPFGKKAFRMSDEKAEVTKSLALNQGLYNLFLAAGLIWSLIVGPSELAYQLKIFFLGCIVIAGIVGGLTANKKIFYIQALPAAIPLLLLIFIPWI